MTDLLARLGDRVNPIVVKEMRQAVNSRLVAGTLLLFLAIQLGVMTLQIGEREYDTSPDGLNLRAGRQVFTLVQGILLGTCMLLIPALTGGRLAAERSDAKVDLLFISSLSPRQIMAGKLFAATALAILIFSACAPFMTFAYVLRGLDVPTILVVLAADFLAVLGGTMFALLLAAVPVNRAFRVFLGVGGFIGLCYLFAGATAISVQLLESGLGMDMAAGEFWLAFAGLAALVLGAIGLMFVWATALISPPTANRALPVRLYTLGFWLAAGAGCAGWSWHVSHPGPVLAWGLVGTALFALQLVTAVSERDAWGPRVARRIPRRAVARVPAFLFYSGAAGGIAFGLIGGGLCALGMWAWERQIPLPTSRSARWEPTTIAAMVMAYAYGYCLTAVLIRRLLRGVGVFQPAHTWVVALLLFGLGCTLPYMARFALYERHYRYGYPDDVLWLYLPNPFVAIAEGVVSLNPRPELVVVFLVVWALAVTLLNVPWGLRQAASFRPPAVSKPADPAPPV